MKEHESETMKDSVTVGYVSNGGLYCLNCARETEKVPVDKESGTITNTTICKPVYRGDGTASEEYEYKHEKMCDGACGRRIDVAAEEDYSISFEQY